MAKNHDVLNVLPHRSNVSPEINKQNPNETVTDIYNERMPDLNLTHDMNDLSAQNTCSYYVLPICLRT